MPFPDILALVPRPVQVQPYFALPWVLTWFAHSVRQFDVVCSLYEAFLSAHPFYSLYVTAAVGCRSLPALDCDCVV